MPTRWSPVLSAALLLGSVGAGGASAQAQPAGTPPAGLEQLPHAQVLKQGLRELISTARDRVFPALVNIHVVTVEYWSGKETKGQSVGSGTIISKDGYILTNAHVTSNGTKFRVTLSDKQEVPARMVGEDPATDLAVLQLDVSALKDPSAVPVAEFADSNTLQVGDYVLAMGSPFALSRSVSLGIVSNAERVFAGGGGSDEVEAIDLIDGQRTGQFTQWIQHDALINPGNSGGPLVNLDGKVVGVNTRGGSGMGFASPSNLARSIAERLIKFGEVPRSFAGVSLRQIDRSGIAQGVLVTSVQQGSPADKAGLRAGDVIVRFNNRDVNVRFAEQIPALAREIADTPVGGTIPVAFLRDGKPVEATITTEKLLRDRGDKTALRGWGFSAEEVTDFIAREQRLADREGVMVTGVRGGGPAALAEPALQGGDVVRAIAGQRVKTLADIVARYRELMDKDEIPEHLVIEFDRRGKNHLTVIKPRPDRPQDPPREAAKAWVGVATQPVLRELADQLVAAPAAASADEPAQGRGAGEAVGFRVTRVYPRTRAADSDLRVGDIITAVNGTRVSPRGMQDARLLDREIRKLKIDDKATLTVLRDGQPTQVEVTLERTRIGPEEARRDDNKDFELTVRELTFFDRDENQWEESVAGVIVAGVERAGWAGLGGIFPGDLIQSIDAQPVTDLPSYRRAMEAIRKARPERVTFVVLRGSRTYFSFVEPDWAPTLDSAAGQQAKPE
jgi:serine protease Do